MIDCVVAVGIASTLSSMRVSVVLQLVVEGGLGQSRTVAKLRLLLLEPRARGRGLGKRLVQECIAFARARGYRKLVLWTQSNLAAARAIYKGCGFELKKTEPHASFGVSLTGEYWELSL